MSRTATVRAGTGKLVLGLALLLVLLPLHRFWAADVLAVVLTLTVPGALLLRACRITSFTVLRFPFLIVAASLLVLLLCGLAVDVIAPLLGDDRPLQGVAVPIVVVVAGGVLAAIGHRSSPRTDEWPSLMPRGAGWALMFLPLIAGLGAFELDSGSGPSLARLGAVLVPLTLLVIVLRAPRRTDEQLAFGLFCCALALAWSFSLRGQQVIGFDISTEAGIAQRTVQAGIWHTNHRNDAYGAMLSVTVLPAVLRSVAGVSVLVALKGLFPVLSAMLVPAVFNLAREITTRAGASIACLVLISQSYFFEQLPALARQEVALIFFMCLLVGLVAQSLPNRTRLVVIGLGVVGMVLSHYSTAYITGLLLGLGLLLCILGARTIVARRLLPLVATALLFTATASTVWNGLITHSASNVSGFVQSIRQDGFDLFPGGPGDLIQRYLQTATVRSVPPISFEALAASTIRGRNYIRPLAESVDPRYALRPSPLRQPRVTSAALADDLSTLNTVVSELVLVACGLGTVLALLGRRARPRRIGVMSTAAIAMLALVRFSGTIAASYNQTRALLQGLLLLLPAAAAGRLPMRSQIRRLPLTQVTILLLVAVLAYQSGATTLVTGGGASVNLANRGVDYTHYYTTSAELSAGRWSLDASQNHLLFADRYGQLRLSEVSGHVGLDVVTPRTLDRFAWLYGTRTNVFAGQATEVIKGSAAVYAWPALFLNDYWDVVYTNRDSMVYHR